MEILKLPVVSGKKIYFTSDFHLGTPNRNKSFEREKKIIEWLDIIKPDCQALFLMGDIFDFWFEYKHVAPKGFVRFLGKIAEFTDSGIEVYFFTGNHDMWMFDYLPLELNVKIFRKPVKLLYGNKKFFLHHGDGLGPFDKKYKLIKTFFNSRTCQKMFSFLHPSVGFWIATTWSSKSRKANHKNDEIFLGEREWLLQYSKSVEEKEHFDIYVFGHRHLKMEVPINPNSMYINLGEWMSNPHFLSISDAEVELISVNSFLKLNPKRCLNQA